jgi:hypothetical protein
MEMPSSVQEYKNKLEYSENIVTVSSENFVFEVTKALKEGKVPLVHFYETGKAITPFYIISNQSGFNSVYKFINYENPEKKIINDLKIKQIPIVFLVNKKEGSSSNWQVVHISGEFSYSNLWLFTYPVKIYH